MEKVLVAGATGYLGQHLVKELKNRGYWVRVLIRKESQKLLFEDIDEFFLGEVTKKETIYGICENIDLIFSSIGITRQKDGLTYMDVDFQGNKNLLVEAQKSKVKAFQYISALNGDKLRHLKIAEAKERFVDELKNSGMQFTIMRPNGFFSDMADFLNMAKGGRVYLFGNGNHKINPIHGADLAKVCVNSIETGNKEVEVGGPEIYTQNEIAQLALKAWNKKVKIIHLPDWIRKLTIWTIRTFTTQKTYGPIEFFFTAMALDNVAPKYGKRKLEDFFNKEVKK